MKRSVMLLVLLLILGTGSGFGYTIPGFQSGGHYFSMVGNPNDCPLANINNTWSAVACIHMVFDYWKNVGNSQGIYDGGQEGNMLPQEEIAHVVNVNDVAGLHGSGSCDMYCPTNPSCLTRLGTGVTDYLRAIHFSKLSASADGEVAHGYSWQQNNMVKRGCTGLLIDFNDIAEQNRWPILKTLLDHNYPVIAFISILARPEDADTEQIPAPAVLPTGHAVLIIGYDESNGRIEIHDPWFGANKHYEITDLFNAWNLLYINPVGYHRFLIFAAPWNRKIDITFPDEATVGDTISVSVSVTYDADSLPLSFPDYRVYDAKAGLSWTPSSGFEFAAGEQYYKSIGVYTPHTTGNASWQIVAKKAGTYSFTVEAGGALGFSSYSYESYSDEIGGIREEGSIAVLPSGDDDTDDDAADDDTDDDDTDDDTSDDDTDDDDDSNDDIDDDDSGGGGGGCGC